MSANAQAFNKQVVSALDFAIDLARERAACGNWPRPETPEEILAWTQDELRVQLDCVASDEGEYEGRKEEIDALETAVNWMKSDGSIKPAKLPWEK